MSASDLLMAAAGIEEMFTTSTYTSITSGSGTLNPPVGAKAMRVAAIGGGGFGYHGGGGGGCAASKIVPASAVSYSIGAGSTTYSKGGDTIATFTGYSLVGGGGGTTGGIGTGGDYNFSGGSGGASGGGGGGAGPNGNGGNGAPLNSYPSTDGQFTNTGWGVGGGAGGGYYTSNGTVGGGGAGAGTRTGNGLPAANGGTPFGTVHTPNPAHGGPMGGGGSPGVGGSGGNGGLVVEWFY